MKGTNHVGCRERSHDSADSRGIRSDLRVHEEMSQLYRIPTGTRTQFQLVGTVTNEDVERARHEAAETIESLALEVKTRAAKPAEYLTALSKAQAAVEALAYLAGELAYQALRKQL